MIAIIVEEITKKVLTNKKSVIQYLYNKHGPTGVGHQRTEYSAKDKRNDFCRLSDKRFGDADSANAAS